MMMLTDVVLEVMAKKYEVIVKQAITLSNHNRANKVLLTETTVHLGQLTAKSHLARFDRASTF